jgi:hypothetical protein
MKHDRHSHGPEYFDPLISFFETGPTPDLLAEMDALLARSAEIPGEHIAAIRAIRDVARGALDAQASYPPLYSAEMIAPLQFKAIAASLSGDLNGALCFARRFLAYTRVGTLSHQCALGEVCDYATSLGLTEFATAIARCALDHYRLVGVTAASCDALEACGANVFDIDERAPNISQFASVLPSRAALFALTDGGDQIWLDILEAVHADLPPNATLWRAHIHAMLLKHYRGVGDDESVSRIAKTSPERN